MKVFQLKGNDFQVYDNNNIETLYNLVAKNVEFGIAYDTGEYILPLNNYNNSEPHMVVGAFGLLYIINGHLLNDDYHSSNARELSSDSFYDLYYNNLELIEKRASYLSDNSNPTVFEIRDDEDILKKILKTAINNKKINLSNYKTLVGPSYANDLRELKNPKTPLSMKKFNLWTEALDLDVSITVDNKPNSPNPMDGVIKSDDF